MVSVGSVIGSRFGLVEGFGHATSIIASGLMCISTIVVNTETLPGRIPKEIMYATKFEAPIIAAALLGIYFGIFENANYHPFLKMFFPTNRDFPSYWTADTLDTIVGVLSIPIAWLAGKSVGQLKYSNTK